MAAVLALLCSCSQNNAVIINGGGFNSLAVETEQANNINEALEIPSETVITTSKTIILSDITIETTEETDIETVETAENTTSMQSATTSTAAATTTSFQETTSAAATIEEEIAPETEASEIEIAPETEKSTIATTSAATESTVDTTLATTAVTTTVTMTSTAAETSNDVVDNTYSYPQNNYAALNYDIVNGVWISYIELYSLLTGKSELDFQTSIAAAYDKCVDLGINTVYVHVRSHGDAFYPSELYPWSKYASGYIGNYPGFDPLKIMVDEAHKRNISFHAWINPLRCMSSAEMSQVSEKFKIGEWYRHNKGSYIVEVDHNYYLNPAYENVINLVAGGAAEIVSKYNVDGIHIDDYFYPTTDAYFDSTAFATSGYSSLSDYRLDNCSKLVKSIYDSVKAVNQTALFGISAQGSVYNNYNAMYADVRKWCATFGYADYMAPQIYYGFENALTPFDDCLDEWLEMTSGTGIKVIPGLAVYKVGESDYWAGVGANEWLENPNIIAEQIAYAKSKSRYGGFVYYSYNYLDRIT